MIYSSKENPNSRYTVKKREGPSLPVRVLFEKNLLVDDILDFGCGLGKDVEFLKSKKLNVQGYDPYYFPKYPHKKFDTIICFYVLNILLLDEQSHVLMAISELLKVGGKAYFAVRRDIKRNGFLFNPKHRLKTYQCNVTLPFKSIFKNVNTEIYEYQHYNQLRKKENLNCPFCNPDSLRELIVESATAYSIYDKFPVNNGHALIIPKKHCSDYFDLNFKEQSACWFILNKTKQIVSKKFNPDGFNVGLNINFAAGQTVPHVHIHLIPRYKGDVKNPTGGVRNVIPAKGDYTISL